MQPTFHIDAFFDSLHLNVYSPIKWFAMICKHILMLKPFIYFNSEVIVNEKFDILK